MNYAFSELDNKQKQIFNIITGRTLFKKLVIDEAIFNTDLVIKLRFPSSKQQEFINKSETASLSQFIYNPPRDLQFAYRVAYEQLINESSLQTFDKDQKNIKIKNQLNFQQLSQNQEHQKQYEAILSNGTKKVISFPCTVKCKSTKLDFFTLKYNTLVYVLQKRCGFDVKSYMIQEQENELFIYLLITQNIKNLMKAADKYRIKKQVDYSQLDLFLNQPTDSLGRPFQNNSDLMSDIDIQKNIFQSLQFKIKGSSQNQPTELGYLGNELDKDKNLPTGSNNLLISVKKSQDIENDHQTLGQQRTGQPFKGQTKRTSRVDNDRIRESVNFLSSEILNQNQILQLYKRVHRNMKDKHYNLSELVIDEKKLSQRQKNNVSNYMADFFFQFDRILKSEVTLSRQQKQYIFQINRQKVNPKCQKEYILKRKRKQVYAKIAELSKKYGFTTFRTPKSYFPFILPSKRLSFMERLRGALFYEEYMVSPFGDLSLFSKMDRIKIVYLTLKQNIRVNNLSQLQAEVFALHNDFERFGTFDQPLTPRQTNTTIKGGINGRSLLDNWKALTPCTASVSTIRNYFGEDVAYQVYLKIHLLRYLGLIMPLHILAFFGQYYLVRDDAPDTDDGVNYKKLLAFHLACFAVIIGLMAFSLESWIKKENLFKQNFIENEPQQTFRYEYKGPYVRNSVNDSINEYHSQINLKSGILKFVFFLLIFGILGIECGIFYGLRMAIVKLSLIIPQSHAIFISQPHIIGYGVYFIFNAILYKFGIQHFNNILTKLENLPTEDAHKSSLDNKNFFFLIGVELIPLIFLLIFQPFAHTACYSSYCLEEVWHYIQTRYLIVFFFLGLKLIMFIILYIKSEILAKDNKNKEEKYIIPEFEAKMLDYLSFIRDQSILIPISPDLADETLAILHYGIFSTMFPLSPCFGFVNLILELLIERLEFIYQKQRPICKSELIELYSDKFVIILHLTIFINCWTIFFTIEQVEYCFQRLITYLLTDAPTYEGLLILKILIIIVAIGVYEILVVIIRYLFRQNSDTKLNNRKNCKYEKHLLNKNYLQTTKATIEAQKIHPFKTIFRTHHHELVQRSKKVHKALQSVLTKQDDLSDQKSSERLFMRTKNT